MLIKCRRSKSAQGLHLLDELLCDGLAGGLFWDLARQGVPAATFQALADELAKVSERKWLPRWTEAMGLGRFQEQQTSEVLTYHEQSARQHLKALVRGLRGLAWALADDPLPPAEPQWLLWRSLLRGETGPACRVPLAVVNLGGGDGRLLWLHGMVLPGDPADTNPGIVGEHPRQMGRVWVDCGEQSATFHPAVVTSFAEAADTALGPIRPGQHGLYWVEAVTAQEVEAATPEALRPPDWTLRRERLREEAQGPLLLQGPSCGGAALRLWAHVRRSLYPDEGVLALAQWKNGGLVGFGHVQDVQAKSDAAGRCGGLIDTLVFVAGPDDAWPAQRESLQLRPLDSGPNPETRVGLVKQRSLRAEILEAYLQYIGQLWARDGVHLRPHHVGDVRAPGDFLSEEQRVALNDSPWLEGGFADPRTGDLLIPPHLTQRFKRGSSEEEGKRIRHPGSIEELKPEDRLRTEPAEWVVGRQARVLIVGEAGLGKTTALRLLAARSARASLKQLQASTRPLGELELPLLTTVNRVLAHKSLAAAVREDLKGLKLAWPAPLDDWFAMLTGCRPWLLLDSVDEAGHRAREFVRAIKDEIQPLARVVLTTRAETEPHLLETIGWAEEARWEIAPSDWLGWTGYVAAWFGPGSPKAKSLVHTLATGLLQAHQNPLLLTLAVQAHQNTDLSPDATPAELYDRCVKRLIQGEWRTDREAARLKSRERIQTMCREVEGVNSEWSATLRETLKLFDFEFAEQTRKALDKALLVLPSIAWKLFASDASGRTFSYGQFEAAFKEAVPGGAGFTAIQLFVVLRHCGLIEASSDDTSVWPHRSFVAYLAARHLAALLEDATGQGFETLVTIDLTREPYIREVTGETHPHWTGPVSDLLRIVRWMPVWEPLLQFLAGHLSQPITANQFLELIWEPSLKPTNLKFTPKSDFFDSTRILAAQLVAYLPSSTRNCHGEAIAAIRGWMQEASVDVLIKIGPPLVTHGQCVSKQIRKGCDRKSGRHLFSRVGAALLKEPKEIYRLIDRIMTEREGWSEHFVVLERIGPALTTLPNAIHRLVGRDGRPSKLAIRVLAAIGPGLAANAEIMSLLTSRLHDRATMRAAARVLGSVGPALVNFPEVIMRLVDLLSDAELLGEADLFRDPELDDSALHDPGSHWRLSFPRVPVIVPSALGSVGPALARCPRAVSSLIRLLEHRHPNVRRSAARVLGAIGPALENLPECLPRLCRLQQILAESESGARVERSHGAKYLNQASDRSLIDSGVVELGIRDYQRRYSKHFIKERFSGIGPALTVDPEALTRLLVLLHCPSYESLRSVGFTFPTHPGALKRLLRQLWQGEHLCMQWWITWLAARMG